MTQSQTSEKETWRLLLFRSQGSELLLSRCADHSHRLPELCIPRGERTVPHLNAGIHHQWGIEAVSLYELQLGKNNIGDRHYHLAEAIGKKHPLPAGFHWVPAPAITSDGFSEPADYSAV